MKITKVKIIYCGKKMNNNSKKVQKKGRHVEIASGDDGNISLF